MQERPPDLIKETQDALRSLGVAPTKWRSQNFMVSAGDLAAIADSLAIEKGEGVVEIGPGLGFLTRGLLERGARVTAVESDRNFAGRLTKIYPPDVLSVVEKDILEFDLAPEAAAGPIKVAGNIPYNITSPIIEWMIGHRSSIRSAVLTVQWEVARRLTAVPGNKDWGSLTVFAQTYGTITLVRKIPKGAFFPPPKVDSAVVLFRFDAPPALSIRDEALYFELVRRAFQKRRKTLLNALTVDNSPRFSRDQIAAALAATGIDPMRRPETLALTEWAKLTERF